MSIGTKIQEIRKSHNLSQQQFAERFGVTRQTVSNWENDKHYPDMEILKHISNEYEVSFDTLIKEDEIYIKSIDTTRKKLSLWKKTLLVSVVLILGLLTALFTVLHFSYKPTPDKSRITTDTNIKMMVDIYGSSPSSAITRTFDAGSYESFSESKRINIRSNTCGKIEGDVPCVFIKNRAESYVKLRFQDTDYKNQAPKIDSIKLYTAPGMPVAPQERKDKMVTYTENDAGVTVFLSDFLSEDEVTLNDNLDENKTAVWFCIFEIKYSIGNNKYVSLTSVAVAYYKA